MTRNEYERRLAARAVRFPRLFAGEHIGRSIAPGCENALAAREN